MKLKDLLEGIEYGGSAGARELEREITLVTCDSRKAQAGSLFVCIAGTSTDGHDFAAAAAANGCEAIVAEHMTDAQAPHIIVADTHSAYSLICANFFGRPASKLRLVGITGTNGKTTTAFLVKEILESSGHKSGLIGTIQNMAGDRVLPAHYTTPEPFELQQTLRAIADEGCEFAVMEVSSHALAQERVEGLHFEVGVFTNLTQDHLDFHKTMENYLKAKLRLFSMSGTGVINLDDPYAQRFIDGAKCPVATYSAKRMDSDYTARNIRLRPDGIDYELVGTGVIGRVSAAIPGGFSVYNTLAAAVCAMKLGVPFAKVIDALGRVSGVKGRIEVVPTGRDFTIIIDYAHTPDALDKILSAIHGFARGRIVAVFGCGGDRDKTKRPIMGRSAGRGADYCIVTSDNPRTEVPGEIIKDILPGLIETGTPYTVIENRPEAIKYAIEHAEKDDIILLAGKGHEDYQIIGHEKHHLDEREVVAKVLAGLESGAKE
jgi:UDP-N-acetylmuramoyl-L-alanyl-D-glutamate--2,6-diaminopimelate ligase